MGTTPTAKQPTMESSLSAMDDGAADEVARDGIVEADGAIVIVDRRRRRRRIRLGRAHRGRRRCPAIPVNSRTISRGEVAFGKFGGAVGVGDVGLAACRG